MHKGPAYDPLTWLDDASAHGFVKSPAGSRDVFHSCVIFFQSGSLPTVYTITKVSSRSTVYRIDNNSWKAVCTLKCRSRAPSVRAVFGGVCKPHLGEVFSENISPLLSVSVDNTMLCTHDGTHVQVADFIAALLFSANGSFNTWSSGCPQCRPISSLHSTTSRATFPCSSIAWCYGQNEQHF